jgi:2-dehydro-3-deoxy-D-gluconate 5-dehydrogenase
VDRTYDTRRLQDPERHREIIRRIPADRWAQPGDFTGPAVVLASAASDRAVGHALTVDGGWMASWPIMKSAGGTR